MTIVFVGAILVIAALGATIIPIIVAQVNDFVDAVPGYVEDLTAGRGRLGFLEREYQITERVREAIAEGGASRLLEHLRDGARNHRKRGHGRDRDVDDRVLDPVHAAGRTDVGRAVLQPAARREAAALAEVGYDIYRTIGGYVTGNLAISLIAGVVSTAVFLAVGVPYAVALGLTVAILDLIPLAGATITAIVVTTVAFLGLDDVRDRHPDLLRPVPAAREPRAAAGRVRAHGATVAAGGADAGLIGAKLAGVVGALAAIPVAGAVQVLLVDWLAHRRARPRAPAEPDTSVG